MQKIHKKFGKHITSKTKTNKIKQILKLLRKKPAVSLAKLIIYKIVQVIIHFVIIIVSYLALIRLRFVELGFRQIKRKYIQYNTSLRLETVIFSWNEHIIPGNKYYLFILVQIVFKQHTKTYGRNCRVLMDGRQKLRKLNLQKKFKHNPRR